MKYCPFCGVKLEDEMTFCPVCGRKYVTAEQHKTDDDAAEQSPAQEKPLSKPMGELLHFPQAPEESAEPDQGTVTAVEDPPQPCQEVKRPRKKWGIPAAVIAAVLIISGIIAAFLAPSKGGVPGAVLRGRGSVVRVVAEYADGVSFGSGFVTTGNGRETYIATNAHVVEGAPHTISVCLTAAKSPPRFRP